MSPPKRILFVDDDDAELQALKRLVASSNWGWEAEFFRSAEEALVRLGQESFDIVVSDFRMPGMDGGEFLSEVMNRHPKVVRLVMAEATDQNLTMDRAGVIHQYLPKPCEIGVLRASIDRAGDLEASLRRDRIMKTVAKMDRLPALPSLYIEMVEKLKDPEVSIEDVGETISRDIAMTAKILKLVNSAFFGLRRQISNPTEAANFIGLDTIKGLVLSLHAFAEFDSDSLGGLTLDAVWNHSMQTAVCSNVIADHEGYRGHLKDDAFVAGMLHDTGKLIMASNNPEGYEQALQHSVEVGIVAAEEEVFGFNHADIGGYLFALWGLPVSIVNAVEFHHEPSKSNQTKVSTLVLVHAADAIANRQHEEVMTPGSIRVDQAYLDSVGLKDHYRDWADAYAESLEGSPVA
jgi:HD-like signal output (HDOD) protein